MGYLERFYSIFNQKTKLLHWEKEEQYSKTKEIILTQNLNCSFLVYNLCLKIIFFLETGDRKITQIFPFSNNSFIYIQQRNPT